MWRQSVNKVLRRLSGLELHRAGDVARLRADLDRTRARLGRSRRQLRRAETRLDRANARAGRTRGRLENAEERAQAAEARAETAERRSAGPSKKEIPAHYDDAAVEILRRVEPRTMTDHAKVFGLVEATRYVVRRGIPGDIVECGVWRGGSMQAVALTLLDEGVTDRRLHLYDTFEGMPPPTDKDRRADVTAEELLATHDKDHRVWAIAGLDDVREAMDEVAYPKELVELHKGKVEETLPRLAPDGIAILRLDTDWYESTRHELETLYDRLAPGGVLILDDYGDWDGARLATDEFLTTVADPPLLLPLGTGRIAVKRG